MPVRSPYCSLLVRINRRLQLQIDHIFIAILPLLYLGVLLRGPKAPHEALTRGLYEGLVFSLGTYYKRQHTLHNTHNNSFKSFLLMMVKNN